MKYWKIVLLDEPQWDGRSWTYAGVASTSSNVEYGDSPVRDKKSRLAFIKELCEAGANFEVFYYG